MEQGHKFIFGNSHKGIVIRCLDNSKGLHEIIYQQNRSKFVKKEALCINNKWELSDESGRVLRDSEHSGLIRSLKE